MQNKKCLKKYIFAYCMPRDLIHRKSRSYGTNAGFSLIELSIALIVISLLATGFMLIFDVLRVQDRHRKTESNINLVMSAIENFYYANDRYPCPANPTLTEGHPNFGLEDCTWNSFNIATSTTQQGLRGAVPHRALTMRFVDTLDSWGNRLSYAVVAGQTDTSTFNPNLNAGEGFTLRRFDMPLNQCSDTVVSEFNNGHFVLFSHGDNGAGAFTVEGTLHAPCLDDTVLESMNCTDDGLFFATPCARSLVTGDDYYDDMLVAQRNVPARIWFGTANNPQNAIGNAGRFGLNTQDPPLDVHMDVAGNILLEGGHIRTHNLCDPDGTNCFPPDRIAGSGMVCPTRAMTGIANAAQVCDLPYTLVMPDECPSGTIVRGFTATGDLICEPPPLP